MADPNPQVAGSGFGELEGAGIGVRGGQGEADAKTLNEDFAKWIRTGLPFVTLKSALTLDGQIAARPGKPTAITGEDSLKAVQRLRHAADALITGIGTVLADDPLLTDRTALARRRPVAARRDRFAAALAAEIEAGEVGGERFARFHHAVARIGESAGAAKGGRRNRAHAKPPRARLPGFGAGGTWDAAKCST